MNVDELTISEAKKLTAMLGGQAEKPCPFEVGRAYLIRTVTMYWLGRVTAVVGDFLVLESAAWVADTGRYSKAVDGDSLQEVESMGDSPVFVGIGAIVDAKEWTSSVKVTTK